MISTLKLLKVIDENTSFFFAISLSFTSFIQSTHIHTERRANKEDYAPKQHRYQNQGKSKKKKMKAVAFKTSKKVVGCFPFSCLFFPATTFFLFILERSRIVLLCGQTVAAFASRIHQGLQRSCAEGNILFFLIKPKKKAKTEKSWKQQQQDGKQFR